jgi:hypothetical protein
MRGPYYGRILTSMTLTLMLAASVGALAQDSNEPAATFNERFPADQTLGQPPLATPPAKNAPPDARQETRKEQTVATSHRVASAKRARSRVVVGPRSFLDSGTEVRPGERKFLDYAFPPTHVALGVVTNTGGRVGWHNSPLPGPFFPW